MSFELKFPTTFPVSTCGECKGKSQSRELSKDRNEKEEFLRVRAKRVSLHELLLIGRSSDNFLFDPFCGKLCDFFFEKPQKRAVLFFLSRFLY